MDSAVTEHCAVASGLPEQLPCVIAIKKLRRSLNYPFGLFIFKSIKLGSKTSVIYSVVKILQLLPKMEMMALLENSSG